MNWFEELTGIKEQSPEQVRESLRVEGNHLHCLANRKRYQYGRLETPSLGELRERCSSTPVGNRIRVEEVIAGVETLHADAGNAGAVFQVASQFNLLEMMSPEVTPEQGVGIYEGDATQGPACAIACGAGTIYRNYLAPIDDQIGQSVDRQIDCLADVGTALGNEAGRLWCMSNGYALPSRAGLSKVDNALQSMSESSIDDLRAKLRIGVQWDTQVTLDGCSHKVTQAYCSAMPVGYSALPIRLWTRFAKLVLEAAYEATLSVGVLNAAKTGSRNVYLTLLGGGVFGNEISWIIDAIERACLLFRHSSLSVVIVSYRNSNAAVIELCESE